MRWVLLALLSSCAPALAGGHYDRDEGGFGTLPDLPEVYYADNPNADDGGPFGWVFHHNQATFNTPDDEFFALETPRGTVIVRLTRRPNIDDPAFDTIEIWELPEGVVAIPLASDTPEKAIIPLELHIYTGG